MLRVTISMREIVGGVVAIRIAKLFSWSVLCWFTKICARENFPLYGMCVRTDTDTPAYTHTHTCTHTRTHAHTHTHARTYTHTQGPCMYACTHKQHTHSYHTTTGICCDLLPVSIASLLAYRLMMAISSVPRGRVCECGRKYYWKPPHALTNYIIVWQSSIMSLTCGNAELLLRAGLKHRSKSQIHLRSSTLAEDQH